MQRWQLTTGLAAAAVLAAVVVPGIRGVLAPQTVAPPTPTPTPVGLTGLVAVPAGPTGPLTLSASLDQDSLLQGAGEDRYLVIEVSAPEMEGDVRRPVHVSVVMDVSGSMAGKGKIDHARAAAQELVDMMGPEDSFSLVTFSDRARVVLPQSGQGERERMHRIINSVAPGGGTNVHDGLTEGLAQLGGTNMDGVKRVIVLSDGMANIGITDPASLARTAGSQVSQGISVSALGLGLDYNEDLLADMSDAGGGQYRFVDQPGILADLFRSELQQMTAVAGREATLEVDLGPGVELVEVYGYSASQDTDGYAIFLGDVHGGETRKVVARVRVPDGNLGALDVADVDLRYAEADTAQTIATSAEVDATVSPDTRVVEASVKPAVAYKAVKARTAKLLDDSARAWDKGDYATNMSKLEEGEALLDRFTSVYAVPEAEEQKQLMVDNMAAFAAAGADSDEGLYQVKKAKEAARATSR